MPTRGITIVVGATAVTLLCSCATILSGTHQRIAFESTPPGATVHVDGYSDVTTPSSLKLARDRSCVATVSKDGYHDVRVALTREFNPVTLGNLLLGGVVGFAVDAGTGADGELNPRAVSVTLQDAAGIASDSARTEALVRNDERGGRETILVCDEDATERETIVQFLRSEGYTVLAAADGHQALELATAQGEPLHLLVSDFVVSGMNGSEFAASLCTTGLRPKTLYLSSYPADTAGRFGVVDRNAEVLPKPFNQRALIARVRKILDGPPSDNCPP